MNVFCYLSLLYGFAIILNAPVSMAQGSNFNSKATPNEEHQTNQIAPVAASYIGQDYYLTAEQITNLIDKADHGDATSAFRLSEYYSLSNYSKQDWVRWLTKASDLGNTIATYNLACYYEYNIHPPQYHRALQLFRVLAEKGNADAMSALGEIYEQGKGVNISTNIAMQWYEKAANEVKVIEMEKAAHLLGEKYEFREAYVWAKVAAIRRARVHIKNNDALLASLSSNLASNVISKLDKRAIELDVDIPYIENWTEW